MRLEDFERKVHEDVGGLYSRGAEDNAPQDHFIDCLNIDYDSSGEWGTRSGLSSSIQLGYGGNVRRFAFFNDIVLILDDNGNLYTFSNRGSDIALNPIINIPDATDFSAIKILGKIFVAFHDGQFGLQNQNLKVYIPDASDYTRDVIRDAAGLAPSAAAPIVAVDGAAGLVNAGTYKIAVAYITTTGFITPPGPKIAGVFTQTSYIAPGAKKINLSNIPLGPAGTSARQILITKADLTEFFFVSSAKGGIINDNVTTTATIDFDDITDLVASAEYLFDLLETIPAPLALHSYAGRLITAGEYNNNSILRGSLIGDVESIDSISGIYFVNKDDGFTIRNLFQLRGTLYIWKNLGAWYVNGNTNAPSSWPESLSFDENVGTTIHGIAEFYNSAGVRISRDWTIVADRSGLLLFDGGLRKPEITNKVNGIWKTINFLYFHRLTLVVDDQNHKIYCSIPTDSSTEANTFLMGDYNLCPGKIPEASQIKWSVWRIKPCNTTRRVTVLGMFNYLPDNVPTLKIGSIDGGGKLYTLDPNTIYDDGSNIETFFESALLFWEPGFVHFFTASRLRISGFGTLSNSIRGEDNANPANIPAINLGTINFRFFLERPDGKIDGINANYRMCYYTYIDTVLIFQNGLLIKQGTDFTLPFGNQLNMSVAPLINDSLQALYLIGAHTTQFVIETPTGAINGVNVTYVLSNNVPVSEAIYVLGFQNGLLLRYANDFTVAGNTVTMVIAPSAGDTLQFFYHKDTIQTGLIVEDRTNNVDGSTFIFNLVNTPADEFVAVFQNGLLLRKFIDYQLVGSNVILASAPIINDTLQFVYRISTTSSKLGSEKLIRFNFQNEKAKLKFDLTFGKFTVNKIEYFGKPNYPMRPM